MFRGRLAPLSRFGASKQGTYWNRYLHRRQPHPLARCSPPQCHPFYVQIARKERIPVPPRRETTTDPFCLTQEIPNGQPNPSISCKNQTFCDFTFMMYSDHSAGLRGRTDCGEVAEWLNAAVC